MMRWVLLKEFRISLFMRPGSVAIAVIFAVRTPFARRQAVT